MMPTRRRRRAADDGQHFERDLGMLHAECVKILARDEGDLRIFNGHGRGGETAAVEDGQLGDGLAGLVDGEDLLAAVDGGFEDADLAVGDDVEAVAGLVLREEQLAGFEVLAHGARGEQLKLGARQAGEQRGSSRGWLPDRCGRGSVRGSAMGKSLSQGDEGWPRICFWRVTKVAVVRCAVLLR